MKPQRIYPEGQETTQELKRPKGEIWNMIMQLQYGKISRVDGWLTNKGAAFEITFKQELGGTNTYSKIVLFPHSCRVISNELGLKTYYFNRPKGQKSKSQKKKNRTHK